jgi:hypothetical protein
VVSWQQFEALDVTTKGQTLFEIMFNAAGAGTRIPRTDPKGENTVLPPCGSGTGGGGEGGRRGGNQGGAQNTAPKKKSRI